MLSAFTGWGMLEFSSAAPRAESIYESLVSMSGGNFDDTFSGPMCAEWYALAMAIGSARDTLERAENQADPATVHEMLPVLEGMYGLSPGPFDSADDRRATLAARYAVALMPTQQNVTQALRLLLGDYFVAWVPSSAASPSPATIPDTMCKLPTARFKTVALLDPVLNIAAPARVRYRALDGDPSDLQDRETLVFDPGLSGIQESVTVLGVPTVLTELRADSTGAVKSVVIGGILTAQFTNGHAAGALGFTGSFPNWSSFKKHSLVVVESGLANDPTVRSKVNDLLSRMLSGTSTWDVVEEEFTTPGTTGPILVGHPSIGIVPIGPSSYVSL
jgi:hypothetical protein